MAKFSGWEAVSQKLREWDFDAYLNDGQRASVRLIAERLPHNGVILADEVGMGKTRIAVTVAQAVRECGGRVAIVIPPGLSNQWKRELQDARTPADAEPLRSIWTFFDNFKEEKARNPWSKSQIQLISHGFANWRNPDRDSLASQNLLVPVVHSIWLKRTGRHSDGSRKFHPDYLSEVENKWERMAVNAAADIAKANSNRTFESLFRSGSPRDWRDQKNYMKGSESRRLLHSIVGLGIGKFDLIIIDEAHKNRGADGSLETLLRSILGTKKDARRLCMTATPVEMDLADWNNTLARAGVTGSQIEQCKTAIVNYGNAISRLRDVWRTSDEARHEYTETAKEFERALSPYLLRRDKREDEAVLLFKSISEPTKSTANYRRVDLLSVKFSDLNQSWKEAVIAAEALSCMGQTGYHSKRLRTTIGSGHGLANIIDRVQSRTVNDDLGRRDDAEQNSSDLADDHFFQVKTLGFETATCTTNDKARQREEFWSQKIFAAGGSMESDLALVNHPAIIAVSAAIESLPADEKILVFGRFSKPMQALERRLNALALIRSVEDGRFWPRSSISAEEEKTLRHLNISDASIDKMNAAIKTGMADFIKRQEKVRDRLKSDRFRKIFHHIYPDFESDFADEQNAAGSFHHLAGLMARALAESLPSEAQVSDEILAAAIVVLFQSLQLTGNATSEEWIKANQELEEEYGSNPRSAYARLMVGRTEMSTRRLLQAAFNNPNRYPRVLIAQSLVGREGLNLHEACRRVIFLHLEWNPAVVEQQIGRVDRVNSLWASMVERASLETNGVAPQIEIHPVVFEGTYDALHWSVLETRWQNLRAQLHGEVIPPNEVTNLTAEHAAIYKQLCDAAPNFSPLGRTVA